MTDYSHCLHSIYPRKMTATITDCVENLWCRVHLHTKSSLEKEASWRGFFHRLTPIFFISKSMNLWIESSSKLLHAYKLYGIYILQILVSHFKWSPNLLYCRYLFEQKLRLKHPGRTNVSVVPANPVCMHIVVCCCWCCLQFCMLFIVIYHSNCWK